VKLQEGLILEVEGSVGQMFSQRLYCMPGLCR